MIPRGERDADGCPMIGAFLLAMEYEYMHAFRSMREGFASRMVRGEAGYLAFRQDTAKAFWRLERHVERLARRAAKQRAVRAAA